MPIELGSFDLVIGMDWLSEHQAEVVCHEKIVRVPLPGGETLIVHGEKESATVGIISLMKAQKLLRKGHTAILALITDKGTDEAVEEEVSIDQIPIVRDFPEVFPEDLPGLPPHRQVEFQIDLTQGAVHVARAPYCLAPKELEELSKQLQELLDKGFIRPSSSPWGALKNQKSGVANIFDSNIPFEILPWLLDHDFDVMPVPEVSSEEE
ncbi:uncharacterized protein LOC143597121 [Bidens hawaiensis]|uniref:uncharacterized protein LOC143597121 n=1 Tax=Bidens hawaiensis TaxID=980011 RepID=UPI00404AF5D0